MLVKYVRSHLAASSVYLSHYMMARVFQRSHLHLKETFDHVISYASIYHLEKDEQCRWTEQAGRGEENWKQSFGALAVFQHQSKGSES